MRLIDADALLDKLKIRDLPIRLTWELLNAPVIDAVPVVHGRFVPGREISREYIGDVCLSVQYEDWRCSICDRVVEEFRQPLWNYCPHCGAKMDDVYQQPICGPGEEARDGNADSM